MLGSTLFSTNFAQTGLAMQIFANENEPNTQPVRDTVAPEYHHATNRAEALAAFAKASERLEAAKAAMDKAAKTSAETESAEASAAAEKAEADRKAKIDGLIKEYQAALDEYNFKSSEAQMGLREWNRRVEEAQSGVYYCENRLKTLNDELEKIKKENPSVDFDKLSEPEAQIANAKKDLDDAVKKEEEAEKKVASLNSEIESTETSYNEAVSKVAPLESALNDAKANTLQKSEALNAAKEKYASLTGESSEYADAQKAAAEAETAYNSAVQAEKDAQDALDKANGNVSDLEKKLSDLKQEKPEFDKLKKDESDAKAVVAEKQAAYDTLVNEYDSLTAQKKDAVAKAAELQKEYNDLRNQVSSLYDQIGALTITQDPEYKKAFDDVYKAGDALDRSMYAFFADMFSVDSIDKIVDSVYANAKGKTVKGYKAEPMDAVAFLDEIKFREQMYKALKFNAVFDGFDILEDQNRILAKDKPEHGDYKTHFNAIVGTAIATAVAKGASGAHYAFENKIFYEPSFGPGKYGNAYTYAENLSWGYDNPNDGWYHREKELYDSGVTEFHRVGHYLNILGDHNLAAVVAIPNYTGDFYVPHTSGERFADLTEGAMPIDEARKAILDFMKNHGAAASVDVYNEAFSRKKALTQKYSSDGVVKKRAELKAAADKLSEQSNSVYKELQDKKAESKELDKKIAEKGSEKNSAESAISEAKASQAVADKALADFISSKGDIDALIAETTSSLENAKSDV